MCFKYNPTLFLKENQGASEFKWKNVGEDYYVPHISMLWVEERFQFPAPMHSELAKVLQ